MFAFKQSKRGPLLSLFAGMALALFSFSGALACEMAQVLFGDTQLDIIRQKTHETALIRHADFKDPKRNFGAFKGELTVDRGGFSIRNNNQVVVGTISPRLEVEGFDESCDRSEKIVIKRVQPNVYVVLSGKTPVGTIEGRFPANSFGVK